MGSDGRTSLKIKADWPIGGREEDKDRKSVVRSESDSGKVHILVHTPGTHYVLSRSFFHYHQQTMKK